MGRVPKHADKNPRGRELRNGYIGIQKEIMAKDFLKLKTL